MARCSRVALVVAAFVAGVADPGRHGRLDAVKGSTRIGGSGEARRLDRRPAAQARGGEAELGHHGEVVAHGRDDHVAAHREAGAVVVAPGDQRRIAGPQRRHRLVGECRVLVASTRLCIEVRAQSLIAFGLDKPNRALIFEEGVPEARA